MSSKNITKTTGSPKQYTFRRDERLTSRKSISKLFDSGSRIDCYPLRIIYFPAEGEEAALKMAVSVPKRLYRRAVDRNLLKRRVREAYRLQKPVFYDFLEDAGISIELVIQYRGREIETYKTIVKKLQLGLERLKNELSRAPT